MRIFYYFETIREINERYYYLVYLYMWLVERKQRRRNVILVLNPFSLLLIYTKKFSSFPLKKSFPCPTFPHSPIYEKRFLKMRLVVSTF